eukprot:12935557-Prorocentrum_lima.AAC.1
MAANTKALSTSGENGIRAWPEEAYLVPKLLGTSQAHLGTTQTLHDQLVRNEETTREEMMALRNRVAESVEETAR